MSRLLFCLVLCLGGPATGCTRAVDPAPASGSRPETDARHPASASILAHPLTFNVGRVSTNSEHSIAFTFRNTLGETIECVEIRPSCSCTDVKLSTMRLEVGEEAVLKGTFKASNQPGPFRQVITATWAHRGGRSVVTVEVVGETELQVQPSAQIVHFTETETSVNVTITNRTATRVILSAPSTTSDKFRAICDKTQLEPGDVCTVTVALAGTSKSDVNGELIIATTYAPESRIVIRLSYTGKESVTLIPPRVALGVVSPARPLNPVTVRLRGVGVSPTRLTVKSKPLFVKTVTFQGRAENVVDMTITFEPRIAGLKIADELVILVAPSVPSEDPGELRVPITGLQVE